MLYFKIQLKVKLLFIFHCKELNQKLNAAIEEVKDCPFQLFHCKEWWKALFLPPLVGLFPSLLILAGFLNYIDPVVELPKSHYSVRFICHRN